VYCCYAERCGSERVSVLNPASFGKLVRIIFPNVQTRRLGVRGESKYHYVDLSVIEDNNLTIATTDESDRLSVNVQSVLENRAFEGISRQRRYLYCVPT
jgi:regulatory factor X